MILEKEFETKFHIFIRPIKLQAGQDYFTALLDSQALNLHKHMPCEGKKLTN